MTARTIRTETRKRGFFGQVFKWSFVLFNVLMAWWMFEGMSGASRTYQTAGTEAARTGAAIRTALGAAMIMVLWAGGALILGLFVLLTRGRKVIVEERPG